MKILRDKFNKIVQELSTEKCKLKIEIKDLSKWKDRANSWIERVTNVKMLFLPKSIYRFSAKICFTWVTYTCI